MIYLISPMWLPLLLLPLLLGAGYYFWSKRQLDRYCEPTLQARMLIARAGWRSVPWLWLSLWSVLVLALAEPVWVSDQQKAEHQPIRWVAVVDVSESMLAEDVPPNRLQSVRWVLESLGHAWQSGDSAGLWGFTGSQHAIIPPTQDQTLWQSGIPLLSPEILPLQGSLLIDTLTKVSAQVSPDTLILVFTDGGDHLDLSSIQPLSQQGMIISVGTPTGNHPVNHKQLSQLAKQLNWKMIDLSTQSIADIQMQLTQYRLHSEQSSAVLATIGTALQPWLLVLVLMLWVGFGRGSLNRADVTLDCAVKSS